MKRRSFLRGLLGLAATAALPTSAVAFLAETATISSDRLFASVATEWAGTIRNIRVYNRALSANELRELTR